MIGLLALAATDAEIPVKLDNLTDYGTIVLIAFGVLVVVASLVLPFFLRDQISMVETMSTSIMSLILGSLLVFCGFATRDFVTNALREEAKEKKGAEDLLHWAKTGEAPAPTPTPEATQEASAPPEPIQLPKVENLDTLWFVLLGIAVLAVVVLVGNKVLKDRRAGAKLLNEARSIRQRQQSQWDGFTERFNVTKLAYLDAETNWDSLFDTPALTDPADPHTANMLRALREAELVDDQLPITLTDGVDLSQLPYPRAVERFVQAWDRAVLNAKKVGQARIPLTERRLIEKIKGLIAIAESSGSSESERQVAYTQAQNMLQKLTAVRIPPAALIAIGQKQMLMLENA